MDAYYILKIEKFNTSKNIYSTVQQLGLNNYCDDRPSVSFKKKGNLTIDEDKYIKYSLTTEKKLNQRGRAYGNNNIFNSFIAINDSCFYYYEAENILIVHSSKDTFNQFTRAFKDDNEYKFKQIPIDFEYIIINQNQIGVQGIWLGQIDDINVKSLLLLGNKLETSDKYRQLKDEGAEVSNITIVYNYYDLQKKIMITKDGGIILYINESETDALSLVKSVYKSLLS